MTVLAYLGLIGVVVTALRGLLGDDPTDWEVELGLILVGTFDSYTGIFCPFEPPFVAGR